MRETLRASRPAGGSSAAGVPPNKTSTIYTKIYTWNLKLYGTSSEYCLDSFHIQLHWIWHVYLKWGSINQSKVCWQGPVVYPQWGLLNAIYFEGYRICILRVTIVGYRATSLSCGLPWWSLASTPWAMSLYFKFRAIYFWLLNEH